MNDNREQLFWEAQETINQLKRKVEKLEAEKVYLARLFNHYKMYMNRDTEVMASETWSNRMKQEETNDTTEAD